MIDNPLDVETGNIDTAVKDYNLLERRYKHGEWRDQNQMDFELGWEAATTYYMELFKLAQKKG